MAAIPVEKPDPSVESQPDDEVYKILEQLSKAVEDRLVGMSEINLSAIVGMNRINVNLERARF